MIPKFPLILTLIAASIAVWMWGTTHVMRAVTVMALLPLYLILMGVWWALRRKGARLRRLAVVVLCLGGAFALFRYEGSADGSAMPSLVFRWYKRATLPPPPAQGAALADETPPAGVADMPRFMGPAGDGNLPEPAWNTDWQAHPPREVWRKPVGMGWSGFAVVGRRAITQEQREEQECVTCYDIATGTLLWSHADKALFQEGMGGGGPRATPTVDVARALVFTLGGTGLLNCLDLKTGAVKWMRDILKETASPSLKWGKSSSPLLVGSLVVCSGGDSGASLIAFQRDTGTVAWKGGADGANYSSPVLTKLASREQIVTVNSESVTGHDPADGRLLWAFSWPGKFPKVCQPAAAGPDRVLITASYGMKSRLLEIKPGKEQGALQCVEIWSSSVPRTKFSSPSIIGAHAYAMDEGTLACVDMTNGERVWREGRYGFGQHVRVGADWLLVQTEKGPVVLIKASPAKLDEVSRLDALHSKTWNPPTLAGRWLLLRNDSEMVCYELPAQ
ncbi:MAG: PQQ-binding-like beta-propeller repeat protein [Prosthecobacter sp.]